MSVALSVNGDLVAGGFAGIVKLWRAAQGTAVQTLQDTSGQGHSSVAHVSFSSDGRFVFAGEDSVLKVWDGSSGQLLRRLIGHQGAVNSAALTRDGRLIVTGGADGTIRIWNAETGQALLTIIASKTTGDWLAITPEGFFDSSANGAKLLSVVQGLDVYSVDQFYRSLYNPDLVREKLAGDPNGAVREAAAKLDLTKAVATGRAPDVTITQAPLTSSDQYVAIEATIIDKGGGVGRMEWRNNGVVLALNKPRGGDHVVTLRRHLALAPGENRIEVVVYNSQGIIASTPAQVTVTSTRSKSNKLPSLYVLAAGVNDYLKPWRDLNFPKSDASAIAAALQRSSGNIYTRVQVRTLFNDDVTTSRLDEAFDSLAEIITPEDVFVFFLSGHGVTIDGKFYFVPKDCACGREEVTTRAINQDQLQEWFVRISAQRALLVVDACESGSLAEDRVARSGIQQFTGVQHLNQSIGRAILSATTDDKPAAEGFGDHGVFTYALLAGLAQGDLNEDGIIDVRELGAFVKEKVPAFTWRAWGVLQVPQTNLSGANFPLSPKSLQALVAAVPGDKTMVAGTHMLTDHTKIRQFGTGAAVEIAELPAGAQVRVIQTKGEWVLIAREGNVIGYVEAQKLKAMKLSGNN